MDPFFWWAFWRNVTDSMNLMMMHPEMHTLAPVQPSGPMREPFPQPAKTTAVEDEIVDVAPMWLDAAA